jgi:probable O-glycosylation ligase (exosortase A-associated)
MRDILVFAVVVLSLPMSIRRPFVGLLVFSWLAYMRPQDLCWGFAKSMRLSLVVAIAMMLGWWAYEQGRRRFAIWDVRTVLICVLGMLVTVSYGLAQQHSDYTNTYFVEYLKIILVALFTTAQCDSRARLRVMLWTIALSLGFFGVKNGLFGLLRGGSQILRGPGGMLEDNNDFALAMVMNMPLLWYLGIAERHRRWVWRGTQIAVVLSGVVVLLTHSRGGFLAMCAMALWIAWRSGKFVRAALVFGVLAALFPLLAPQSVLDRLSSIGDAKDASAHARLTAWATALRMIQDNPLFGVGLRNFQTRYPDYSVIPITEGGKTYVSHNSYLQIWAENGSLAFAVYLALLASVFVTCRRIWRMSRVRPDLQWAGNYARMMEATMAGFLVGSFFLSRGQFDLVYTWLALVTALATVAAGEWMRAPAGTTVQRAGGITVTWKRPRGLRAPDVPAVAGPRWR